MALILAVNPGGKYSAALGRLARELPGHELIGADSCTVAIAAVDRRAPDLVLIPSLSESEVEALLARLRNVPAGVRTLDLPMLASDNSGAIADFAVQVRESLAAPPWITPRPEPRPHLIAAGTALARWVRARRATWSDATTPEPVREAARTTEAPEVALKIAAAPGEIAEAFEETTSASEARSVENVPEPAVEAGARVDWGAWRDPIVRWLPRIAALAALIVLAGVAFRYLPNVRSSLLSGVLVLESGPAGSEVFVDGRVMGTTPISVSVPPGRHSVEFRNGSQSRTTEVSVGARSRVVQRVDWATTPTASLQVRSEPSAARVIVDGGFRGTTPLTLDTIAAGTHVITIESKAGSVRRMVNIAAGQAAELTETIFPGTIAVFAPFEIELTEGSRLIRLDDRGRASLAAGPHKLRFRNRELGYDEVRTVEIVPGETATLNLTPQTTISVTSTEPAEVLIDGTSVGQTPVTSHRINLGLRAVLVKTAAGVERTFTVTATAKPVQIDVDFSQPQP